MANTPVEAFDSGSNYNFGSKMEKPNFPSSVFDLSHLVATTINNCGEVQVIDCFPTLPGDDIEIKVRSLLRALPQVVPLYSRQRIYTYAFYSRCSDLWANWNTFMTKGYTGDVIKTIPVFNDNNLVADGTITAGTLGDNFGLPQGMTSAQIKGLNCLKAMMLLRIWRDYFMNKNYYINDRVILPDDDTRFRLNDNGQLMSAVDENVDFYFDLTDSDYHGLRVDGTSGDYTFTQFCHDWPEDYFTSALPWPQRGTQAELPISITNDNVLLKVSAYDSNRNNLGDPYYREQTFTVGSSAAYKVHDFAITNSNGNFPISSTSDSYTYDNPMGYDPELYVHTKTLLGSVTDASSTQGKLYASLPSDVLSGSVAITLNALRELTVDQTELEKMARTDGSYYQFGLTFFGEKAKNAQDFKPLYIGGCYDSISYTEVLQTSQQYEVGESSVTPVGSPLGTYGGHGIGSNNGYLGRVHCDDFGYIMILSCVMPDVYYHQGITRDWFSLYQADMFLPERAKLGLRPILKKELMFTGTQATDDDLWAYQNPFDEFRYLPNIIKGKIADSNSENFWPYTQARDFASVPEFGSVFAEASDVRKDYLSAYDEVAFTAQFAIDIRAVRPLPYKPVPADILN